MSAAPFLTFPIRGKKDVIRVRHRARQIASLLQYSVHDQACIAAGTFVVASQMLDAPGPSVLCFQLEANQLHIYARSAGDEGPRVNRIVASPGRDGTLLRLARPLPTDRPPMDESDLAWMIKTAGKTAVPLFEEVSRQNQEVLTLLHELHVCEQERMKAQPIPSNAA
jgi:hypothetical protein